MTGRRLATAPDSAESALAALVGHEVTVRCADGHRRRYLNLDSAASTPALRRVAEAVDALMPWYSSVHRGAGLKSQVSTAAFEGARAAVADFVDARDGDVVIFLRNTTEAINALSAACERGSWILSSPAEHHANMLPWRRHRVELLPFASSPDHLLAETERVLARAGGRIGLVAVTGASNVTGEVWPIRELADLAHVAGAEIFVDAAQLAPHRPISLRETGVDYLALSGHKLYAPYGAGALVGRPERLARSEPFLRGGGAVRLVTVDGVAWAGLPDRFEAGSPNVAGAVALGVACDVLAELGMERVAAQEKRLAARLGDGLARIPGIRRLRAWEDGDRLGVATFLSDAHSDRLLATILGVEHGIGVRSGRFCAHPLMARLMGVGQAEAEAMRAQAAAGGQQRLPGAVRASIGLGIADEDVDRFLAALEEIVTDGPALEYVYDERAGEHVPSDDPRAWPELPFRLHCGPAGEEPC